MNLKFTIDGVANSGVNLSPPTGSWVAYYWQQMMKQQGGVVQRWSDGTTMTVSSAGWSSGNSGAGGAGNNSAYCVITAADGKHYVLQRGTSNTVWRAKISPSAGFTGGSPSATVPPTAADEQNISGSNTPTFFSWLASDGSYRMDVVFDADPPYFWAIFIRPNGGGATIRRLWYVPMLTGTYPVGETAPYIAEMAAGAMSVINLSGVTVNVSIGQSFVGGSWVSLRAAGQLLTGVNPITSADDVEPVKVYRLASDGSSGRKGGIDTRYLIWRSVAGRQQPDYFDVGATAWAASTAYTLGQVRSNGGNVYECIVAGTSAGSGGPSGTGSAIVDGTVTWKFVAVQTRYIYADDVAYPFPLTVLPVS